MVTKYGYGFLMFFVVSLWFSYGQKQGYGFVMVFVMVLLWFLIWLCCGFYVKTRWMEKLPTSMPNIVF